MQQSNQPTTEARLKEFENSIQLNLPTEYREYLLKNNGGRFDSMLFRIPKFDSSVFGSLFGLDIGGVNDFNYVLTTFKDRIPSDFLAIGRDLGGNLILIGVKGKYLAKIYFWWHEDESDKKPWLKNIFKITNTFTEFLDSLEEEKEEKTESSLAELFKGNDYKKQLSLIESGWDVNTRLENGDTAIEIVARAGSIDVLKALIASGARLDWALESALRRGNVVTGEVLLESGADPNAIFRVRNMPLLLMALSDEQVAFAGLLIKYNADVTKGDTYSSPLSMAEDRLETGNKDMQEIIDLIKSKMK